MLVEAIYDHGRIELPIPLRLKHDRVRVVVDVPDDEIAGESDPHGLPEEATLRVQEMLDRFAAIKNADLPPEEELPQLTVRQIERIEAFASRAQVREQQGRAE